MWSSMALEAVFIGGREKFRPIRKIWVGADNGAEMNFFASGPLAGTRGMYS